MAEGAFPHPLVVPPLELPHKHTFIILHGRGSNADSFSRSLLHHPIPACETLRKAFPQAKFIFPTAATSPATAFSFLPIPQWFDYWPFAKEGKDHEPEVKGLKASCDFLHGLIRRAVGEVGASNVIVGGLSQGCATSLVSMLLWDGPPIAACFGMCGWLPFREPLTQAMEKSVGGGIGALRPGAMKAKEAGRDEKAKSLAWLREVTSAGTSTTPSSIDSYPVFLGHGVLDEKVPVTEARGAHKILSELGSAVTLREYEKLAHWYSGEMLKDIVDFVRRQLSSKGTRVRSSLVHPAL